MDNVGEKETEEGKGGEKNIWSRGNCRRDAISTSSFEVDIYLGKWIFQSLYVVKEKNEESFDTSHCVP